MYFLNGSDVLKKVIRKNIFIAGPSDTDEYKKIVKEVIESLNNIVCQRIDVILYPKTGSTHFNPGVGRPQSRINPNVEDCDLFIGIFNKKYGSPTGDYKSGTEEEFMLAFSIYQDVQNPEIFLWFKKHINEPRTKDYRKIMEFREKHRTQFYQLEFKNDLEFMKMSYEQITQWLYLTLEPDNDLKTNDGAKLYGEIKLDE